MALHHRLGGSTTKRYFHCAVSIVLTEWARKLGLIPQENESTEAARVGTCTHHVGEKCLEIGCAPIDFLGDKIKVEGHTYEVDSHMVKSVEVYVNACRDQVKEVDAEFQAVELNSELKHLFQGEDVGGPCDFICYGDGVLVIMDYKNGTHPVEIDNNSQFLKYGLGCYEKFKNDHDFHTLRTIVIQPNCHHRDGPVRHKEYSIKELLSWKRRTLRPAVSRVVKATELVDDEATAMDLINGVTSLPDNMGPNAEEDACHFCPIMGICAAHKDLMSEIMKTDFSAGGPLKLPAVESLTVDEAERILLSWGTISKWKEQLYNHRKAALLAGVSSERFKIVESRGNRVIKNERRLVRRLKKVVDEQDLYVTSLHTPATLEKVLYKTMKAQDSSFTQKRAKDIIDEFTMRPPRGESMVLIKDGRTSTLINAVEDFATEEPLALPPGAKGKTRRSKRRQNRGR